MKKACKKLFLIGSIILSNTGLAAVISPQECISRSDKWLGSTQLDSAIIYANKAIALAEKNDHLTLTKAYKNIGLANYYLGNHPAALSNYQKAIKIAEPHHLNKELVHLYNLFGTFYKKQNNLKLALESFQNESRLATEIKDASMMASALNDIGLVYQLQDDASGAIDQFSNALALYNTIRDSIGMSYSLNYLGEAYSYQKKFDLATEALKNALEIRERMNDRIGVAVNLNNIGELYMMQNDDAAGLDYFFKSIELSKKMNISDLVKHTYKLVSAIYLKQKNFEKAYHYYELHVAVKDSIYNQQNARLVNEMEAKYQNEKKQLKIDNLNKENTIKEVKIEEQETKARSLFIALGLLLVIVIIAVLGYRNKQKANRIISSQKIEVEMQRDLIAEKNKEVTDSIHYAKRIQGALLAGDNFLKKRLNEYFILYKPKDIVSGDFYWASSIDDKFVMITADCTGHGVPGAFMSLLNISYLNEAITEKKIVSPDKIIGYVRNQIIHSLNPEGAEIVRSDGMDAVLCVFDFKNMQLQFACANNPLWIIRDSKLIVFEADKMPVGIYYGDEKEFTLNTIGLCKGDVVYTFTDGYADQFGGNKGKKFKYKKLQELLLSNHKKEMDEQKNSLEQTIEKWRGELEQIDDILVIGIKI